MSHVVRVRQESKKTKQHHEKNDERQGRLFLGGRKGPFFGHALVRLADSHVILTAIGRSSVYTSGGIVQDFFADAVLAARADGFHGTERVVRKLVAETTGIFTLFNSTFVCKYLASACVQTRSKQ